MAKTILLADDSLTIQKVVELTFMDQDYQVTAVGDGLTALSRWTETQPDLVIADVHMPGADGYEVCRQVKRSRPGTPVLLLVGTFETFDEAQAQSCGSNGHLKKPFDSQELFRLVERLIADSAARQAPAAPSFQPAAPSFQAPTPAPAFAAPVPASPFAPPAAPPSPFASPAASPFAAPVASPSAVPAGSSPFAAPADPFAFPPAAAPVAPAAPIYSPPAPSPTGFSFGEPAAERAFTPAASFTPEPYYAPEPSYSAVPEPSSAPEPGAEFASAYSAPPEPVAAAPVPVSAPNGDFALSDADVDRIARRVAELIGDRAVKEIAWEVLPDLAEVVIKERIRELENQVQ